MFFCKNVFAYSTVDVGPISIFIDQNTIICKQQKYSSHHTHDAYKVQKKDFFFLVRYMYVLIIVEREREHIN